MQPCKCFNNTIIQVAFWVYFVYKKERKKRYDLDTFIKSFSIIKYSITLFCRSLKFPQLYKIKLWWVHKVFILSFLLFFFFKQRPVLHVPTTLTRQDYKLFTVTNRVFYPGSTRGIERAGWGWVGGEWVGGFLFFFPPPLRRRTNLLFSERYKQK